MKINYEKRLYIEKALKEKKKVVDICRELGISRDTFYKEIHRSGMNKETYSAKIAQIER